MARRVQVNYFAVAANSNEQQFTFLSPDNNQTQHIRKVYVGMSTAGWTFRGYVAGGLQFSVDLSRFADGNTDLMVEYDVPTQIPPIFSLQDLSGTGAASVPVVIEYDVAQ